MRRDKESLLIILCTSFYMFGFAGSRPLITLYSSELGASNTQIGIIIALYSVLPLLLSISIGKLVDKFGKWKPLIFSIFLGSLSLMIPFLINGLFGVYISQTIAGLAQIVFVITFQSYVGRFSKRKLRNYYVSIFSIGMAIGHFIGPLASGFLADKFDYSFSLVILGFSVLLTLPFIYLLNLRKQKIVPKRVDETKKDENSIYFLKIADLRKAFLISAIILLAKDIFVAYFPLLAIGKGFSNTAIGLIIALNAAAGILIRIILPFLITRFKENAIIVFSIVGAGIIFVMLPFLNGIWMISIVSLLLGLCLGIGQPLSISLTINNLPTERVGEGLGFRLTINKLTQVTGPILLGGISNITGIGSVFYICGFTILAGAFNISSKKRNN